MVIMGMYYFRRNDRSDAIFDHLGCSDSGPLPGTHMHVRKHMQLNPSAVKRLADTIRPRSKPMFYRGQDENPLPGRHKSGPEHSKSTVFVKIIALEEHESFSSVSNFCYILSERRHASNKTRKSHTDR